MGVPSLKDSQGPKEMSLGHLGQPGWGWAAPGEAKVNEQCPGEKDAGYLPGKKLSDSG